MVGRRLHRGGLAGPRLGLVRKRRARKIQHGYVLSDRNCVPTAVLRVGSCAQGGGWNGRRWRSSGGEFWLWNAVISLSQPRLCLEHLCILGDELLPKFVHHPLDVLRLVMIAVARPVTKL